MRFILLGKFDNEAEAGIGPRPELTGPIGNLIAEMTAAGVLVDTAGLMPSATGVRLRGENGRVTVTDGPFPETKEVIGGYAIVDVASRDEAIAWARRFLQIHIDVLGPSHRSTTEVRPLFEAPAAKA
jgi:hypothetical protein